MVLKEQTLTVKNRNDQKKNVQLTSIDSDSESERWHHDSLERLRSHNSCSRHLNVNVLFWVFAETALLFFILQKKTKNVQD